MENTLQNMLVLILGHCFSMTNTIPKHLNDPLDSEIITLCEELSAMLKEYMDEVKSNS